MSRAAHYFEVDIRAIAAATRRDIQELIDSGSLQPLSLSEDEKVQSRVRQLLEDEKASRRMWAARGVAYVEPIFGHNWTPSNKKLYVGGDDVQSYMVVGDKFYGARRDQLRGAGGMWLERDALAAAYVSRIVQWFVESGVLDATQANAIIGELAGLMMDETSPR